MGNLTFRLLRADEIDARVGSANDKGITLLLYKDARCDQNILDETVGPMNWQRHHSRDNANCIVSIWDSEKAQWIEKEDTGTESKTEAEKGLASDSFKRACFNWGIGRELYTAPLMWIPASELKNGAKDRFKVIELAYSDRTISMVKVRNTSTRKEHIFGEPAGAFDNVAVAKIGFVKAQALAAQCKVSDVDERKLCELYKVAAFVELTENQHSNIINHWDQVVEKCKRPER